MSISLLWEFFKIGLFSVGGGLSTLPFLHDLSLRTGWFSLDELADMMAVSEATPGAVGVNMATYVGFTVAGVKGAIVATVGLAAGPLIVIILISRLLKRYSENRYVKGAMAGLRPASIGLICVSSLSVFRSGLFGNLSPQNVQEAMEILHWKDVVIAVICGYLWKKTGRSPVLFILLAGAAGCFLNMLF